MAGAIDIPDLLPLGSIVTTKGSPQKLMVIGRGVVSDAGQRKAVYYDYSLCFYPAGVMGDAIIFTNHDCVEKIYFRGYETKRDALVVSLIKKMGSVVTNEMQIKKGHPSLMSDW